MVQMVIWERMRYPFDKLRDQNSGNTVQCTHTSQLNRFLCISEWQGCFTNPHSYFLWAVRSVAAVPSCIHSLRCQYICYKQITINPSAKTRGRNLRLSAQSASSACYFHSGRMRYALRQAQGPPVQWSTPRNWTVFSLRIIMSMVFGTTLHSFFILILTFAF